MKDENIKEGYSEKGYFMLSNSTNLSNQESNELMEKINKVIREYVGDHYAVHLIL